MRHAETITGMGENVDKREWGKGWFIYDIL
jgi:hypothetical protein